MSATPDASVVVTTKDRERRLRALLRSLRGQELGNRELEVIVVDNASTDGTAALLERERNAGGLDLRVISSITDQGTGASRNLGWEAARAPLIAFTDDDCEPAPDWLASLLEAATDHPGAVLQGRTEPIPRERPSLGPFARTKRVSALGPYFETCNIAYPRELLERLDGFDADTFRSWGGEDTDLAWRALGAGADAVFVERAVAYHAVNQLGAGGMLRLACGWSDAMAVVARHPEIRQHLHHHLFWKRSHELLLAAAAGALLARRRRFALLLTLPYLRQLRFRAARRPWLIPYLLIHDALEIAAAVRGAVRHRTVVL